ncbi:MAG TPA: TRAP transporter large permease [Thermomonas sp.]|jgi:C4-dicarboxylate transporter DctM subunit|uniref:TRAP transporter large permease n=1 Tax=Ottowia sp. TaxID=1898956 RepID=UPI001B41EE3D|nr:TRAP transporter large permease [Ottowia sp.]MBP6465512.1 TRAP transporter large permease [Rubrivivax sp.]MBP7418557.1 TRAP transporter large permease [Xanthomonadales bacterium]HOZ23405.1 TRAP transporter large permease [Thermomonas sp.]HPG79466.1 TRAP transporter large permease [Piscinibacter sp.]MBK6613750.1 TRAP transporter large permease [Ottowia sp.]
MTYLLLGSTLLLFAIGMPVAFAMVVSAGAALLSLGNVPLMVLPQRIVTGADSFPLMAIPLFLLAGNLMIGGGLTDKLSRFATAMVGHFRGGLAQVNVVNSMVMGGMTGSAIADAVSDCKILVPVMVKSGYSARFAAALSGATAVIAPIIPPSIPFIIYGSIAGVSIGQLFLGGAIPGILMGVYLMVAVNVIARRRNFPRGERPTLRGIVHALRVSGPPLMLPVIILGGILAGVFTPTEAGAVAVVYALVLTMVFYRSLGAADIPKILLETGVQAGVIMLVIAAASPFSWLLAREQVGQAVVQLLAHIGDNKILFLLVLNVVLLVLGMFLDATAILIIVVPVLVPVFAALGLDPVHMGVMVVMNLMIGMVTPPFGLVMYVVCDILKVTITDFTRELWPFLLALVAILLTITYVPELVLFLPKLAMR